MLATTNKRYSRDNRLMLAESSQWRKRLAHRRRLSTSWWWSSYQGFPCSGIKVLLELGLDRRETGWLLSSRIDLNIERNGFFVRKDQKLKTSGVSVMLSNVPPSSYVRTVCKNMLTLKISAESIWNAKLCSRLIFIGR